MIPQDPSFHLLSIQRSHPMNLACFSDFLVLLDCHLVRVWYSVDLTLPFKAVPQAQKRIIQFLLKLIR